MSAMRNYETLDVQFDPKVIPLPEGHPYPYGGVEEVFWKLARVIGGIDSKDINGVTAVLTETTGLLEPDEATLKSMARQAGTIADAEVGEYATKNVRDEALATELVRMIFGKKEEGES
jgi:hypothetical protein